MLRIRWMLLIMVSGLLVACGERESSTVEPVESAVLTESSPLPAAPACELVMGWDPWEPYQYEIAGGQVFGLDVDLVTAVARQADCSLTFEKGTWRELLQQLRDGEIDVVAGATPTEERQSYARFTVPYRGEQFELFIRAGSVADSRGKDLATLMAEGWRIGVVEDYLYTDTISSLQDDPEFNDGFVYTAMAETNMSRLLEGGIDGLIEDKYVGAAIIRHKNLQNDISRHPVQFSNTQISIMVSRASVDEALFQRLDDSVQTLRENGAIGKILAQYGDP